MSTTHIAEAEAAAARLSREDVLTAGEVAELLQLPLSTVYYLARQGELPASRFGRTYRFSRLRLQALFEGASR